MRRKAVKAPVASESKWLGWLMLSLLGVGTSLLTVDEPELPFPTRAVLRVGGVMCFGLAFLYGWAKFKRLMA